jgi:hypothetical protein
MIHRGDTTPCATVSAVTDRHEELGIVCSLIISRARPKIVLDIIFKPSSGKRKAHWVLSLGIQHDLSLYQDSAPSAAVSKLLNQHTAFYRQT